MQQAVFSLKNYSVVKVMLDLENIPPQCIFDLKIEPSGIYFQRERQYVLNLVFKASYKKENTDFEGHYKIFCVNGNTGFRNESRIFYFIHLQNEEAYERKESSSA